MAFYTLIIIICPVLAGYGAQAQQSYIGHPKPEAACNYTNNNNSNAGSSIYLGYYSNGPASCTTSLTIRSQYPYNTLSGIASLLSVDADQIAQANPNYNTDDVVEWNKLIYVPVTCSGDPSLSSYYLKRTTRTVVPVDSYFHLANNTYQGLVTCQAIRFVNSIDQNPSNFAIGQTITIPLRCACPTQMQRTKGITALLTYVVGEGDTISSVSTQLKVDSESIRKANRLSEKSVIYPFTTLLIPLTDDVVMNDDGSSSSSSTSSSSQTATPPAPTRILSKGKIIAIIVVAVVVIAGTIFGLLKYEGAGPPMKFWLHATLNCCSNNSFHWSEEAQKDDLPSTNNNKKAQKVCHNEPVV